MTNKEMLRAGSLINENKRLKKQLKHVAFCLAAEESNLAGHVKLIKNLNIFLREYQRRDEYGDLYELSR